VNRRRYNEFLAAEWRRGHRNKRPLCLLMLDLDNFKQYNDDKGHLQGDLCLKAVADILRIQAKRGTDLSARFGGDEFSLVLGETPLQGGQHVAAAVLEKIRALGLKTTAGKSITASIGLACRMPGAAEDCADGMALVALADNALYAAKAQGKNRLGIG